jgi:hypothetical protein
MSADLRNSIHLWIGVLAIFGIFWIASRSNAFNGISETWVGGFIGLAS